MPKQNTPPPNPMQVSEDALTNALLGGVKKIGGSALDLLDRGRQAVQADIAGRNAGKVFTHGETPGQSDNNRAVLRHRLGLDNPHSFLGHFGTYQDAPHWEQGLVDAFLDTATDPVTYAGGAGLARKAFLELADHGGPMALRAFEALRGMADAHPGSTANRAVNAISDIAEHLSNATTPGGEASAHIARTLAVKTGSNRTYQQLYALRNVYDSILHQATAKYGALHGKEVALKWLGRTLKQKHPDLIKGGNGPTKDLLRFFTSAQPTVSNPIGKQLVRGSNLAKATLFYNPLPHSKNIATLTGIASPIALAGAVKRAAQLSAGHVIGTLTHNDALRARVMKDVLGAARSAGASHVRNLEQSQLINALQGIPGIGKALAVPYKIAGHALWGFDDAAKAALYERNLKIYKDRGVAAYHTLQQLVDYSHQSPMIAGMRQAVPFATWRARMPKAVFRAMLENPQNVLGLNRVSGGLLGGGKIPSSEPGKVRLLSNPVAEALQLDPGRSVDQIQGHHIPDALKYIRGSLGPSADTLGGMLVNMLSGNRRGINAKSFLTDWKKPTDFLKSRLPYIGTGAALSGHGLFGDTPKDELLYQLFGVETQKQR